jgi:hypothetical protein
VLKWRTDPTPVSRPPSTDRRGIKVCLYVSVCACMLAFIGLCSNRFTVCTIDSCMGYYSWLLARRPCRIDMRCEVVRRLIHVPPSFASRGNNGGLDPGSWAVLRWFSNRVDLCRSVGHIYRDVLLSSLGVVFSFPLTFIFRFDFSWD